MVKVKEQKATFRAKSDHLDAVGGRRGRVLLFYVGLF